MREATHEEQQSVNDYVESISVDTGVNFFKDHSKNQQENHRNSRRKSGERSERSKRRKAKLTPEESKKILKMVLLGEK